MKIDRIDIQTSNKKHATDIAMLVDKLKFLQAVNKLREKWKISVPEEIKPPPFPRIPDIEYIISKNAKDQTEAVNLRNEFNKDVNKILKNFNRGKNFKPVVECAIVVGCVPEGVYRSCYFDVVTIKEPENMELPERYEYIIVLSPRTEKKEIEQAYKEFKMHIKNKIKFNTENWFDINNNEHKDVIEQYHPGTIYKSADADDFKTQKELQRTREWYWIGYGDYLNKLGKRKRSEEILNEWQLKKCPQKTIHKDINEKEKCPYCSVDDVNIIDHALASYMRLLQIS